AVLFIPLADWSLGDSACSFPIRTAPSCLEYLLRRSIRYGFGGVASINYQLKDLLSKAVSPEATT
ncbi:MAG: hypothetical protein K8R59_01510, partial [Thermoanaerobaculales bacterium]|nr:hypothetical protein [Thermoanaerobaculales bacterium]